MISISIFFTASATAGFYAPAPGQPGSTAIHMDDVVFVGWAAGRESYIVGTNVSTSRQTPVKALGQAVGNSYDIVGLGRVGQITLTFDTAIYGEDGYDFAVFENSFNDTYLGLAGKYKAGYGTPFDLSDLTDDAGLLDIGNILYDPYPTSGSAGFDLDALAVTNTPATDSDGDTIVDYLDYQIFRARYGSSGPFE